MVNTNACWTALYGLDDNGNFIDKYSIGFNSDAGVWKRFAGILRGFGDVTHFKVGFYASADNSGDYLYFDEFKLLPLRSINSHKLVEEWSIGSLQTNLLKVLSIGVFGECWFESMLRVTSVSGTDPTLDVNMRVYYPPSYNIYEEFSHTTFTGPDYERLTKALPDASYVQILYVLGGTSPSFDFHHQVRIIPK